MKEELTKAYNDLFDIQLNDLSILDEKINYDKKSLSKCTQIVYIKMIADLTKSTNERSITLREMDLNIYKYFLTKINAEL